MNFGGQEFWRAGQEFWKVELCGCRNVRAGILEGGAMWVVGDIERGGRGC